MKFSNGGVGGGGGFFSRREVKITGTFNTYGGPGIPLPGIARMPGGAVVVKHR